MNAFPCIECNREVSRRQQGISCDDCERWQHRTCGTGISQTTYHQAMREEIVLNFVCKTCEAAKQPVEEDIAPSVAESSVVGVSTLNLHQATTETTMDENCLELGDSFNVQEACPSTEDSDLAKISIIESPLSTTIVGPTEVTYETFEKGSKRGGRMLVSSDGYRYGIKKELKSSTLWRCNVRGKHVNCHVTVRQHGDAFHVSGEHVHARKPEVFKVIKNFKSHTKVVSKVNINQTRKVFFWGCLPLDGKINMAYSVSV